MPPCYWKAAVNHRQRSIEVKQAPPPSSGGISENDAADHHLAGCRSHWSQTARRPSRRDRFQIIVKQRPNLSAAPPVINPSTIVIVNSVK